MNKNDIISTYVLHNKNGISSIGKIKSITQQNGLEYLNVQFENTEKTFPFPDIIAPKYNFNFIFLDKDIQKYVESLFIEKYSVSSQKTETPKIFNNQADDKLEQIIDIFDEIHTDFSTVIDLLFDKIIKERSISFLYEKEMPVYEKETPNQPIQQNNNVQQHSIRKKMTKRIAIDLLKEKGYKKFLNNVITFASRNSGTLNYWANPHFNFLNKDWSIILNNVDKKELYLFFIPANSISKYNLLPRADKKYIIDLQIMYNDPNFTDTRSNFVFKKYFIAKLNYTEKDEIYG